MSEQPLPSIRVLLVEDEPLVRWAERKELEARGCLVTEAESCHQAEQYWTAGSFDLILLDHRLPDGLGSDLLRVMRNRGRRERVVYLSADTEQISEEIAVELEIDAVLSKPLNQAVFRETVAGLETERPDTDQEIQAGCSSCSRSVDPGEAGKSLPVHRFTHIPLSGRLTRNRALHVESKYREVSWLALDMQNVKQVETSALPVLLQLARACREAGGRFCMVGLPAALLKQWRHTGLSQEVDILCDVEALESLCHRLSQLAERAALLNSVVPRIQD